MTDAPEPRKGMPSPQIDEAEFRKRFLSQFIDPAFDPLEGRAGKVVGEPRGTAIPTTARRRARARRARSSPTRTTTSPIDWIGAREAVEQAQREHDDPDQPPCILLVNGSSRSEHTCPGEMSKSWRLLEIAREICGVDGTLGRACSTCRGWRPSTGATSTRARPASRPRRRSATGRAAAIPNYCARPDPGLDERHLPDVGAGARHHDHHPGELVLSRPRR